MKIAGIVLLALGLLGLLYGGFRYTTRENVVEIGSLHITAEREHTLPIVPIAGAALVAAGAVMLVVSRRTA